MSERPASLPQPAKDLGLTEATYVEHIRRIAEVARLMVDAGLIVMTAFLSLFRSVRGQMADGKFIEIHVNNPLAVAEEPDMNRRYKKARCGKIANFRGISLPYETPEEPKIAVNTHTQTAEEASNLIIAKLKSLGSLNRSVPPVDSHALTRMQFEDRVGRTDRSHPRDA